MVNSHSRLVTFSAKVEFVDNNRDNSCRCLVESSSISLLICERADLAIISMMVES